MNGWIRCMRALRFDREWVLITTATAQALAIAPSAYTLGLKGEGEDGSSLFEILLGNGTLAAVADMPTV